MGEKVTGLNKKFNMTNLSKKNLSSVKLQYILHKIGKLRNEKSYKKFIQNLCNIYKINILKEKNILQMKNLSV